MIRRWIHVLIASAALLLWGCTLSDDDGSTNGGGETGDGVGDNRRDVGGDDAGVVTPDVAAPDDCEYPAYSGALTLGETMPPFVWEDGYDQEGGSVTFDLAEFYCDDGWANHGSIVIVITAGWCPNCPGFLRNVNDMAPQLVANGALIIYLQIETAYRDLSTHADAHAEVTHVIGSGSGWRFGDGETLPTPGVFANSPYITGVPSAYVVRRSDMQIIGDQNQNGGYYLDFVGMTANPGDDWAPSGATYEPNCGEDEEEEYEDDNDFPGTAPVLSTTTVEGGVCSPNDVDLYNIDIAGGWQVDLLFSHAVGDLDMFFWDKANNSYLMEEGQPVGSWSTTDDEQLQGSGPTTIIIEGYQGATAPYNLLINAM